MYGSQKDNLSAWFVDSLVKVFPDSPAATSKLQLDLASARNGHTSLQIALRSEEHRVVQVRVIAPRLGNAALKVQTYRVGTVKVNSHPTDTPLDDVVRSEVGPYPDPLFPLAKEFSLEGSHTETIWVSVFTPEDTRPGIYPGAVEIDSGKQKLKLPFRVEVFAASVPKEQKLWVTNWLWLEQELMAKHYPQLKSDQNFRDLQAQLEGTENRITVARNRYIQAVQNYNVTVRSFPGNLTAMIFGYKPKANFAVENEAAISKPPSVDFAAPAATPAPAPTPAPGAAPVPAPAPVH